MQIVTATPAHNPKEQQTSPVLPSAGTPLSVQDVPEEYQHSLLVLGYFSGNLTQGLILRTWLKDKVDVAGGRHWIDGWGAFIVMGSDGRPAFNEALVSNCKRQIALMIASDKGGSDHLHALFNDRVDQLQGRKMAAYQAELQAAFYLISRFDVDKLVSA